MVQVSNGSKKKSEMDLGPRMDLRWTFWTFGFVELQHLYGHCPAVRLQVVQLLRCGAMGAPRCSHLFVMFSCGLCHGKSWNGKKETRISKAMKWWMTWALNFERNFDLRTSHICFWRSSPLRMAIWLNPQLLGQAWAAASRSQARPLYVSAVNQLLKPSEAINFSQILRRSLEHLW